MRAPVLRQNRQIKVVCILPIYLTFNTSSDLNPQFSIKSSLVVFLDEMEPVFRCNLEAKTKTTLFENFCRRNPIRCHWNYFAYNDDTDNILSLTQSFLELNPKIIKNKTLSFEGVKMALTSWWRNMFVNVSKTANLLVGEAKLVFSSDRRSVFR